MKLIDKDKIDEILRNLWKEDDGHNSEHRICYNKALQEVQIEVDKLESQDTRKWLTQFVNCQLEELQKDNTSDDDLEQFADEWDESLYRSDAVIAGAKWMKEKMIKNAINGVKEGYLRCKEEMLKNAIKCNVDWYDGPLLDYTQEQQDDLLEKIGAKVGDKVKVIFVKDE